jgi:ATP-dependent Clp protease ATP-binding subunit ClpB
VLDDGRLTDGQGRTVDFKNAVVVMTSNLGNELWGRSHEATRGEITAALRQHFRPEFLNRIDEVVVFHSLSTDEVRQIVDVQLDRLSRLLADRRLTLSVTDAARDALARAGWDPDFGARPLKRAIQRELQDPLALRLLQGEFREGSTIRVDAIDGQLTFVASAEGEAVPA